VDHARAADSGGGLNVERLDDELVLALAALMGISLPPERIGAVAQTLRDVLGEASFLGLDTSGVESAAVFDASWR
jgi:hypothetical protein